MRQEVRTNRRRAWAPRGPLAEGTTVCFVCDIALPSCLDATSRGVEAQRPFVGNAMWVTTLSDLDGYNLLFESPTNVPEETVLDAPEA